MGSKTIKNNCEKKTFKMPPNNETIALKSKPEKSESKPKKYSRTEEVLSIKRKLEKVTKGADKSGLIIDHGQAFDLLQRLGEIDINFGILKETMIGFTVHALKKSSTDEEIISKSKSPKSSEKTESSSTEKATKGTYKSSNGFYEYDGTILFEDEAVRKRDGYTERIPKRNSDGVLIFPVEKEFRPNMTPKEVLQAGSFGGTYFRPIKSSVTGLKHNKMWNELPQNWLEGLNIKRMVSSTNYDDKVNTYKAKCGGSLEMWETSGWIDKIDPYGWFMWYCRFYLGRRCKDDDRQIGRWKNCTGSKGRWKNNLIGKIARAGVAYNNPGISPVIRQTLQHWAYRLNEKDYQEVKKRLF